MSLSGTVVKWLPQKGCGFVKGDNGEEYFTTCENLIGGNRLEHDGRVTFDVEKSRPRRDMKKTALNVSGPGVAAPTQGKDIGTVIEWYPSRGYGFIMPAKGRDKVYVHASAFDGANLVVNKTVFFDSTDIDHKTGRKVATNVSGGAVKAKGSVRCIVKKWFVDKGYGFVEDVATGDEIFIHASAIGDGSWLEEGKEVYCDTVKEDKKGGKKSGRNVSGYGIRDPDDQGYAAGAGGYGAGYGGNSFPSGRGGARTTSAAAPAEKRADTDGKFYTKAEFVAHYGGTKEWDEKEKRISPANGHAYTKDRFLKHFGGLDEWKKAKKAVDGAAAPKPAPKGGAKAPGGNTIVGRGGGRINLGQGI